MTSFSQFRTRIGNRIKQRFVPKLNNTSTPQVRGLARGNPIVITDASEEVFQEFRVIGKSIQNGTPTPDTPAEIMCTQQTSPTVTIRGDDLTPTAEQSLTIKTAYDYYLDGIPVADGGNYIDADGQQWLCDELDLKRGVEYRNVLRTVIDSSDTFDHWGLSGHRYFHLQYRFDNSIQGVGLCSHLKVVSDSSAGDNTIWMSGQYIEFRMDRFTDPTELKAWLNDNPITFIFARATPAESELHQSYTVDFRSLHPYEGKTTIYSDQGIELEVKYTPK